MKSQAVEGSDSGVGFQNFNSESESVSDVDSDAELLIGKALSHKKKKKMNGRVDSILSFDGHENDVMMQYLHKLESLERTNRDMMQTIQSQAEKADTFRKMYPSEDE